jgi:hypothetical protein
MFIGKIVDRMDTYHPTSKKRIKAKYEDATKTKYVAGRITCPFPLEFGIC